MTKKKRKPDKIMRSRITDPFLHSEVKRFSCKQNAKGAAFSQGAYIDVRDQEKT